MLRRLGIDFSKIRSVQKSKLHVLSYIVDLQDRNSEWRQCYYSLRIAYII